jgi:hypothetical protein
MQSLVGKPASWLGLQVLGRMPRLERTANSLIIGFLAFAAGASAYLIPANPATQIRLSLHSDHLSSES